MSEPPVHRPHPAVQPYHLPMLRLLRLAILLVMTSTVVACVIAIARPETGTVEKVALAAVVVSLFIAAGRVRRIGARPRCAGEER